MDIAVDVETYYKKNGKFVPDLNAPFLLGVIMISERNHKVFMKKEDMWDFILELGVKEARRGHTLNVYGHNHAFDFYKYGDYNDKNISHFSESPFIKAYKKDKRDVGIQEDGKKEIIKFLDTYALYKMPLKKMGDLIGCPKLEMPIEEEASIEKIAKYCIQDCKVVYKGIKHLKGILRKEKIGVKRLYTRSQIAGNNLLKELSQRNTENLFETKHQYKAHQTLRAKEIHKAYRGGRCDCFKTGSLDNITYIDCNSLYPYAAGKITVPHLKSERKVFQPLKYITLQELLKKEGVSKCLILNKKCDIGLLPVRTPQGNYFFKKGVYGIGSWTHIELRKALEEGYDIIDIEYSVIYHENGENYFKEIMEKYYDLRKRSEDEFSNYFYKSMMNDGIGKLAQHRTGQEIIVDDIETTKEYLEQGFVQLEGIDNSMNVKFVKKESQDKKKFYMPIIPTFINAYARVMMYDMYKKVGIKDLVYTDTDSILFKGNHLNKFELGDNLGEFKVEHENESIIIYGKKTYAIGTEIKIAGFRKRGMNIEDFKKGEVSSLKMITFQTQGDTHKAGDFITEERNLNEQLEKFKEISNMIDSQQVIMDQDIEDISYFRKTLVSLLE